MRLLAVIRKSLKEQFRQIWILLLTVSMAPFFILVYYLIEEASSPSYDIVLVAPVSPQDPGREMLDRALRMLEDSTGFPVHLRQLDSREEALQKLRDRSADAAIVFTPRSPASSGIHAEDSIQGIPEVEFIGDLTDVEYMVAAIWAGEVLRDLSIQVSGNRPAFRVRETALGTSGSATTFELYVPGIIILSVIMLMFTATIAMVTEVEQQTIIRLKISRLGTLNLLTGISLVQVLVGFLSVFLTLAMALALGFRIHGQALLFVLLILLTCLSIIAFSLILAALTKTVNEVLVVGNFPLFLFMFFTGAAFPLSGNTLFRIAGYPVTLQGIMSPTHAVHALKKVLVFGEGFGSILPELGCLVFLTLLYFFAGAWAFHRRYMRS